MADDAHYAMAVYRPHPGKEAELLAILEEHVPTLRQNGLVTDRPVLLLQSRDGALIEIFQWASVEAIGAAHKSAVVRPIWDKIANVAEFLSLSALPEAEQPFSDFRLVRLQ